MAVSNKTIRSRESRRFGYLVAVAVNALMLYVFNNLENWNFPFITEDFSLVLWALELSIGVTILSNLLLLVFDPPWFRSLIQLVQGVFGFVAVLTLFRFFPFDFGPSFINSVVRFALGLALVGIVIAAIVDLVRLFSGRGE